MELADVSEIARDCGFQVFSKAVAAGGVVKGLAVPGGAKFSRKDMDNLTELAKTYGAKGLAWIKVGEGEFTGAPVKFFQTEQLQALSQELGAGGGDMMMFVADRKKVVNAALAALRNEMGKRLDLRPPDDFRFVWITEFPLLEWNEEGNCWDSSHHPFTAIHEDDVELLLAADGGPESKLGQVRSLSYDLVLNGVEMASGSVRIHDAAIQKKIFELLGITAEQARERFGFFTEALTYGTPPHAGIAPGIDRLVAKMLGHDNIREVIAFPKTAKAADLMTGAPGAVDPKQLRELGIKHASK